MKDERAEGSAVAESWYPSSPRVLIATCMKNEGPFILEWLAWHRAIGVTDFVVFSNDCADGSDALLDRLDALGLVQHLPNPCVSSGSTYFQPAALAYVMHMRAYREADFFISMDVDEFINIRAGQGRLTDLFEVAGAFDALSMTELNHGSNGHEHFEDGWMTEQFPGHQTETPGKWKAQRGVKTIVRLGGKVEKVRNHRPDFRADTDIRWIDGSGRDLDALATDAKANGIDCRGTYEHVVLDHFALRSLESYLAKMDRGDVVIAGKQVSPRYWRLRNQNGATTSTFERQSAMARTEFGHLLADRELSALHAETVAAHKARIADLLSDPHYQERRDWILENAW